MQGCCLWSVAVIVYPKEGMPRWNLEDHASMIRVTALIAAEMLAVLGVMVATWMLAAAMKSKSCRRSAAPGAVAKSEASSDVIELLIDEHQ